MAIPCKVYFPRVPQAEGGKPWAKDEPNKTITANTQNELDRLLRMGWKVAD